MEIEREYRKRLIEKTRKGRLYMSNRWQTVLNWKGQLRQQVFVLQCSFLKLPSPFLFMHGNIIRLEINILDDFKNVKSIMDF